MNNKATRQELMVLRRIPLGREGRMITIAELRDLLRASEQATLQTLIRLCKKDLIRTDTQELTTRSRSCFRTDAGDHVLLTQSSKSMRDIYRSAA